MHMADALITPGVGATMWAATAVTTAYCAKKVREEGDQAKVPLMGVTGAFVFSAQMLNFAIPATGSSGHLGGGLLLAILLGPHAAFLVIASVLTVQALFFADGGLLALGCNIFNLGAIPAFVAYPLVYRRIVNAGATSTRILYGSVAAAVIALALGSLAVVGQTVASGISALPLSTFAALMLPIHLAIGVVEGLATAAVLVFVSRTQPEILDSVAAGKPLAGVTMRSVLIGLLALAVLSGGAFAWFASSSPDGLEWAIEGVTGSAELETGKPGVFAAAAALQERLSFLPDYGFGSAEEAVDEEAAWPAVDAGTSVAGIVGGAITLLIVVVVAVLLTRRAPS